MEIWIKKFNDLICDDFFENNKIKKLIEINSPKNLYKYKAISKNTMNSIENDTMWVTSPEYFNDPYDCALIINSNNVLQELISTNHEFKELEKQFNFLREFPEFKKMFGEASFKNILENFSGYMDRKVQLEFDKIRNQLAIACLTENNNSILMWSHYAYNHKGICLEYDFNEVKNMVNEIYPVIYTDENYDLSKDIVNTNPSGILKKVLSKSEVWSYEKEWRIICDNKDSKEGYLINFPKIKSIYLGCKINENDKKDIIKLANRKGIDLYQMRMEKNKFKLVYDKI